MNTDLSDFIKYIGSAWGLLAGITAFFPFFESLTKIIPLSQDIKKQLA